MLRQPGGNNLDILVAISYANCLNYIWFYGDSFEKTGTEGRMPSEKMHARDSTAENGKDQESSEHSWPDDEDDVSAELCYSLRLFAVT